MADHLTDPLGSPALGALNAADERAAIELFDQAVDIHPSELNAWLDAACEDNPRVRPLIKNMLTADARTQQLETRGALLQAEIQAGMGLDSAIGGRCWLGVNLGAYRITEVLGEGGMGRVFLAERSDGEFSQVVAIKLIRSELLTQATRKRFEQERQLLSNLRHPNIASVFDGGTTADGIPYQVMEYVEGQPLDQHIQTHNLRLRDILKLFCDICSAVQFAHQALIVHRDIKPSNILVTKEGTPKLLDFGIAKDLSHYALNDATQAAPLTPAYASPEQLAGQPLTTATDVYSLGIVLYEALCKHRPYELAGLSPAAAENLVNQTQPKKLSEQLTSQEAPRTKLAKSDLDAVVARALAKEPQRRYATAGALMLDIKNFLGGRPVSAKAESSGYLFHKFLGRHRLATAATALAAVAVLTGLAVSVVQTQRANQQLLRATAVSEYLQNILMSPDPTWLSGVAGGPEATVADLIDGAQQRLQTDLLDQPDVRLELLDLLGEAQMWMNNEDAALQARTDVLDFVQKNHQGDHERLARALDGVAEVHDDFGRSEKSLPMYDQAIVSAEKANMQDKLFFANLLNDAAVAQGRDGHWTRALNLQNRALVAAVDSVLPASSHWQNLYGNLGFFQANNNQLPKAKATLELAELRFKEATTGSSYYAARYNHYLALVELGLGNLQAAQRSWQKSLSLLNSERSDHVEARLNRWTYSLWLARISAELGNSSTAAGELESAAGLLDATSIEIAGVWLYHHALSSLRFHAGDTAAAQDAHATAERFAKHERVSPIELASLISDRVRLQPARTTANNDG